MPIRYPIRYASIADLPAIMAIEKDAETAAHWCEAEYRQIFGEPLPSRLILVAEENGAISAFLIGRKIGDEWELENLVVTATLRRTGLASRLIEAFLNILNHNGAKEIFLEVRESNLSARRLYENSGFIEVGRRRRYYQQPDEDALLLKRRL